MAAVNQWVSFSNGLGHEDQCDEPVTILWYYFGPSGKAYTGTKKTIDGNSFIFDDEGHMLSGWQTYGGNSDWYYLGTEDEGFVHTGWQYLELDEEMDEDTNPDYEMQEWFYLRPDDGKAYRNIKTEIDGEYYTFDVNGAVQEGWVFGAPGAPEYMEGGAIQDGAALYADESGDLQSGWVYAYAPDDVEESGEQYWYYLDGKGVPFNYRAQKSAHVAGWNLFQKRIGREGEEVRHGAAARVINNKTYVFDEEGRMLTGVFYLQGIRRQGGSPLGLVLTNHGYDTGAFYYLNRAAPESESRRRRPAHRR